MNLKDLHSLEDCLRKQIDKLSPVDVELPSEFKEKVKSIKADSSLIYNRYTFIYTNRSGQIIIYPNQCWYIASYLVDLYDELCAYKDCICKILEKKVMPSDYKISSDDINKIKSTSSVDEGDRLLLEKFVTDLSWWGGGKQIARNDFFVSPLLSTANVINASNNFLAELTQFLATQRPAVAILKNNIECSLQSGQKRETINSALQQIFYGAPGTGKSHAVKERTEGEIVIRTTFHPDSDYSTFVGAYKPTMTDGTWAERILSKDELTQELKSFRDSGITYESVKFGAKYSSSLSKLNSGYYRDMLNICDIPESKSVEITKGVEAGRYLKAEFSKNSKIAYSFVAQAFLQAYVAAWRRRVSDAEDKAVFLVIEEINRGNCAQIFGDLFQLLDRDDSGFSEYPVTADADMRKYLSKELAGLNGGDLQGVLSDDILDKVLGGELLILPDNMYIWATMNTSDQSLFPIDSAFKRRWDWTYIPIENAGKGWKIAVGSERYDWWDFLQKINDRIGETTSSEDKKLGYFFCKARDGVISADTFVSKVVFYLWNDVFKDYDPDESIFSDGGQGILTFNRFYEGFGKVNDDAVRMMLTNLKVAEESGEKNTDDGQTEVAAETE